MSRRAPEQALPSRRPVTVCVLGEPRGKGRHRTGRARNGAIVHYTPPTTKSYEAVIRLAAQQELLHLEQPPFDEPVYMDLRAVMPIPASWSQKKRQAAILGEIRPGKKPDIDNLYKLAADALNGIVYRDDALIVHATLSKIYGVQPKLVVTVGPMAA